MKLRKKTGLLVDGYGNKIEKSDTNEPANPTDVNSLMLNNKNINNPTKKDYKNIDSYKPSGIYNTDQLKKLELKFEK